MNFSTYIQGISSPYEGKREEHQHEHPFFSIMLPFQSLQATLEIMFYSPLMSIFLCRMRIMLLLWWPHAQIQRTILHRFQLGQDASQGPFGKNFPQQAESDTSVASLNCSQQQVMLNRLHLRLRCGRAHLGILKHDISSQNCFMFKLQPRQPQEIHSQSKKHIEPC